MANKVNKFAVATLLVLSMSFLNAPLVGALRPQCATLGRVYVVGGKTYTCVKSGNKIVLKKGLVVVAKSTTTTTTVVQPTTTTPKTTTTARQELVVGMTDPTTGGVIIADAGVGNSISVGKTSGRFVVVVPSSCEYQSTWSSTVKAGYSCGGKSDWDVPTIAMYFQYIFPVIDPPPGTFWSKEIGSLTDVAGVYSGFGISNVTGGGEKKCPQIYSCAYHMSKREMLQVLPVRAFNP